MILSCFFRLLFLTKNTNHTHFAAKISPNIRQFVVELSISQMKIIPVVYFIKWLLSTNIRPWLAVHYNTKSDNEFSWFVANIPQVVKTTGILWSMLCKISLFDCICLTSLHKHDIFFNMVKHVVSRKTGVGIKELKTPSTLSVVFRKSKYQRLLQFETVLWWIQFSLWVPYILAPKGPNGRIIMYTKIGNVLENYCHPGMSIYRHTLGNGTLMAELVTLTKRSSNLVLFSKVHQHKGILGHTLWPKPDGGML